MKNHIIDLLGQVWQNILPVIGMILSFFQPIQYVLLAVGAFILLDTIMAYIRTRKTKRNWTSRQMRIGLVPKLITYQLLIITFFMVDFALLNEFIIFFTKIPFFLTKITAIVLVYIEILSIDESFKVIKGKSIFSYFMEMIKSAKKIKTTISEVNENKKQDDTKI
jgi:hypothetical protein